MRKIIYQSLPLAIVCLSFLIICQVVAAPPSAFGISERHVPESKAHPRSNAANQLATPQPLDEAVPDRIITGAIGRRPIYTELVNNGATPSDVLCVAKAFEGVFDFRNARPRDRYELCLSAENEIRKFTYRRGPIDQFIAVRGHDGTFQTYRETIPVEKRVVAKTFIVDHSLYQAVTAEGEGGGLVSAIADIFSWDIDFYLDPRKGDHIRILYEKEYIENRFIRYGRILAAVYSGRIGTFSAFYYDDGERWGYYDQNGVPLRKMFMRVPVKFGMRTSSFSTRRFHPVTKTYRRHTGIDYGAPMGTPIFATASGTVTFAGWRGGYGKLVIVRHPNGYRTYYGHCSRLLVKKGKRVDQGETIARVGRTGQATGPHVHYEIRINNTPVNPNRIKTTKGDPLPTGHRTAFAQMVDDRMHQLDAPPLLSEIRQPNP